MSTIQACPLHWPPGWPRTSADQRQASRYKVRFSTARDDLMRALRLIADPGFDPVVSSDVPVRRDGLIAVSSPEPGDPGVAAYWTMGGRPMAMACDRWRTVRENVRALGLAIEALRQLDRTGASEIVNRAYSGFQALPAPAPDWAAALGLQCLETITETEIRRAYHARARALHPDVAGDTPETRAAWLELQGAFEDALACVSRA